MVRWRRLLPSHFGAVGHVNTCARPAARSEQMRSAPARSEQMRSASARSEQMRSAAQCCTGKGPRCAPRRSLAMPLRGSKRGKGPSSRASIRVRSIVEWPDLIWRSGQTQRTCSNEEARSSASARRRSPQVCWQRPDASLERPACRGGAEQEQSTHPEHCPERCAPALAQACRRGWSAYTSVSPPAAERRAPPGGRRSGVGATRCARA